MIPSENPVQDSAPNPLVEAALSHLSGDAEQRLTVRSVLLETADPDHPQAAETIARWESVDQGKYPFAWKTAIFVVALAGLISALVLQQHEIQAVMDFNDISFFDPPEPMLPKDLSEKEKLLLGDFSLEYYEDHKNGEALYLSEPDNPAYFTEYALKYSSSFDVLPPGFLETAARIDPQNSFYLYLAAGMMDYDAIDLQPSSGSSPKPRIVNGIRLSLPPVEREYKINDQAVYEESLELIKKASELSGFRSFGKSMMRERMRCFRHSDTTLDRMHALILVYWQTSGVISLRRVSDTLSARAQELSKNGDKNGFLEMVKMREHFIEGMLSNPDVYLVTELINMVVVAGTAEYFHYAAKRLGLNDLEKKFGDQHQALREMADRRKLRPAGDYDWMTERSSYLTGFTLPMMMSQADSPPLITAADLAPQRYADHALAMRMGLSATALSLLIFALPIYLFRFVFPASLRKTADRLTQLLRPMDWILAFSLGVILPLSGIILLNRFTELGGREWALSHFLFLFPGVHLVAILLWISLAPAAIIRWCLLRRVSALGLSGLPAITAAPALMGVTVLTIAAYPAVMKYGLDTPVLIGLTAPVAFWLSVVFGNGLHGLIGRAQHRISLAATSMAILPCLSFAIITVLAVLPLYKASEIHWLAQDTLYSIDPDAPDLGQYEFRVATQKRKEIREALGMEN